MEFALVDRIRHRAYEIWHADGRPDGNADQHWLTAEREILSSLSARSPAPEASLPPIPAKGNRVSRGAVGQRSARPNKSNEARAPNAK